MPLANILLFVLLSYVLGLRHNGGQHTNDSFSAALGKRGLYKAARAIAANLEFFGLLQRVGDLWMLTPLAHEFLANPTGGILLYIATYPYAYRPLWRAIAKGDHATLDALDPDERGVFEEVSLIAGCLTPNGDWLKDVAQSLADADLDRPTSQAPTPSTATATIPGIVMKDAALGVTVTFPLPLPPFPDELLQDRLLNAKSLPTQIDFGPVHIDFTATPTDSPRDVYNFLKGAWRNEH